MANQGSKRYAMETLGEGRLRLGGSFAPNGSSALATAGMYGTIGWTGAYTSTGLYTITLRDKYQYLLEWSLGLAMVSSADGTLQLGAVDMAARTIQIRHLLAGTLADVAADAANRIGFSLIVQRMRTFGKR